MEPTSVMLIKCCQNDFYPNNIVKQDYFGYGISDENEEILLGIYSGMIKIIEHEKLKDRKTMIKTFHKAFETNSLVELIHECYDNKKYNNSGYYKAFCKANFKIKTFYNLKN